MCHRLRQYAPLSSHTLHTICTKRYWLELPLQSDSLWSHVCSQIFSSYPFLLVSVPDLHTHANLPRCSFALLFHAPICVHVRTRVSMLYGHAGRVRQVASTRSAQLRARRSQARHEGQSEPLRFDSRAGVCHLIPHPCMSEHALVYPCMSEHTAPMHVCMHE